MVIKKGEEKKKEEEEEEGEEEEEEEKGEEVKQWCVLEATGKHSCLEVSLGLVLKVKVRNKKNKQWKDNMSLPLPL